MTLPALQLRRAKALLAAIGLAALAGCAAPGPAGLTPGAGAAGPTAVPGRLVLTPVDFSDLPGWLDDDLTDALPAMRRSCDRFTVMPPTQPVGQDGRGGLAADWFAPCGALRHVPAGDRPAARSFFETWFHPYRATDNGRPQGLFTGYYEAELRGSRHPGGAYRTPLYARPAGLPLDPAATGQPYFTRAEIEAGALRGRAPALLWVDDPVDAHILQIQGSGRVILNDGSAVHIGFNGSNGQRFVGLGRILLDHGKITPDDSSMQTVRAWLKGHPAEAPGLMAENPRYVFFRLLSGDGPIGAAGVVLTPGRSLAVDPHFIPLGAPLWLDSSEPDGRPLRRLMLAQDAGAAIKGPVRGDVFWGAGEAAFEKAGRMKSRGSYYLLLPLQHSVPVAAAAVEEERFQ